MKLIEGSINKSINESDESENPWIKPIEHMIYTYGL